MTAPARRGSSGGREEGGARPIATGRVTFRSSREATVRVGDEEWRCELLGALRRERDAGSAVVVGDRVEVVVDRPLRGRIARVLPRTNRLSRRRSAGEGRELVLAANIDRVLAMFSAREPRPKFGALDRLLLAAEAQRLPVAILFNKMDLGVAEDAEERLAIYPGLGYPVHRVSLHTERGLEEIEQLLSGSITVVVGPSGVGKSTLVNRLIPGLDLAVSDVSEHNEKGRHTTTAVTWYELPRGGAILDTPGFREYSLWGLAPGDVAGLMPEFRGVAEGCRFADCTHREEPECAVRQAVADGRIAQVRYDSYRYILEEP